MNCKILSLFLFLCGYLGPSHVLAQKVVYDAKHFAIVNANAGAREAAEATHQSYLKKINDDMNSMDANAGTLVAAQTLIFEGLNNVDGALKNGLMVKDMAVIIQRTLSYTGKMASLAQNDPVLLLFAGKMTNACYQRGIALLNDVSAFVLADGKHILMDYNARDEQILKIYQDLQLMEALAYGGWQAMYYAKANGLLKSLTPFPAYINNDRLIATDIARKFKYLKQ